MSVNPSGTVAAMQPSAAVALPSSSSSSLSSSTTTGATGISTTSSSSLSSVESTFVCVICMEDRPNSMIVSLNSCVDHPHICKSVNNNNNRFDIIDIIIDIVIDIIGIIIVLFFNFLKHDFLLA